MLSLNFFLQSFISKSCVDEMKLVLLLFSLFTFAILCYGRNEPRIWNGVPVGPEKYPNVVRSIGVLLNMNKSEPAPNIQMNLCTGTVISSRHILIAGHCVTAANKIDDKTVETLPVYAYIIDSGEVDANFPKYINLTTHGFTILSKSNTFNYMTSIKDDVGIIEFPEGYDLNITPVVLAKNFVEDGSDIATNVGYAKTSLAPPSLMEINVTIWKECAANVGEWHVMCVGNKTHHADQGDSGGPLFLTRGDQMYQIGIAQSVVNADGSSPGDAGDMNLFTRVSHYCDWIEDTTKVKCVEMPPRSSPASESSTQDAQKPNGGNGNDAILKSTFIILMAGLFASVLNIALFF